MNLARKSVDDSNKGLNSKRQYNLALIVSSLAGGGAERVVAELAAGFAERGHRVTVITWNRYGNDLFALDRRVRRIDFDRMTQNKFVRPFAYLARVRDIRRLLKDDVKPDVLVSFIDVTNQTAILASVGLPIKTIATQHLDPRLIERRNPVWEAFSSILYGRANRVLYLDDQQADWARKRFPRWRISSMPNPLPQFPTRFLDEADIGLLGGAPHIAVAMGRLAPQKGFDLLLVAFDRIKDHVPDWNLVILGEGNERRNLEAQIQSLGLARRVTLAGFRQKPHGILARCHLFVLSSRSEGQPLALAEAMSCGLPCISYDCPSGPSFLFDGGKNGRLVTPESVEHLAEAMRDLMTDPGERRALGERGRIFVRQLLDTDSVLDRWEHLFSELS